MPWTDDSRFRMMFVTIPSRVGSARFQSFYGKNDKSLVNIEFILKRREPKQIKSSTGEYVMGWTPSCSDSEFEEAIAILLEKKRKVFINIEGSPSEFDLLLVDKYPSMGVVLSGHELGEDAALSALKSIRTGAGVILALENEPMLLAGSRLIESRLFEGLIVGSSYLSEYSRMYDQMGLERFRILLRGLSKIAKRNNVIPISTSNYCTFEESGAGDKNLRFAMDQIEYAHVNGTGCLSRFYLHMALAQRVQEKFMGIKEE